MLFPPESLWQCSLRTRSPRPRPDVSRGARFHLHLDVRPTPPADEFALRSGASNPLARPVLHLISTEIFFPGPKPGPLTRSPQPSPPIACFVDEFFPPFSPQIPGGSPRKNSDAGPVRASYRHAPPSDMEMRVQKRAPPDQFERPTEKFPGGRCFAGTSPRRCPARARPGSDRPCRASFFFRPGALRANRRSRGP